MLLRTKKKVESPDAPAESPWVAPPPKPVKFRRTWPERFILVVGVVIMSGCLYGAWYISDIKETFGDIPRVAVSPGVLAEVGDVRFDPRNILILGWTDSSGIDSGDDLLAGREEAKLADTMMLVRIDPTAATAAVISIPRDLSFDGYNKINSAVALGPENAVNKVKKGFDVEIHDFVEINFSGFRKIIDSIDGVPVYFPYAARDFGSFFDAPAGCNILSGQQALNYVRSRKYEQNINGSWVQDNKNDYGRAERQRDFLILAMDRVIAKGGRNPTTMRNLLKTTVDTKSVVLDEKLTPGDLLDIGRAFGNFQPEALQRYSLPTYADGTGNLRLDTEKSGPVLDVFRGNVPDLQPFQVPVTVVDARPELTEPLPTKQLADAKFNSGSPRKSPYGAVDQTTIRFTSDERYAAILLARYLNKIPAFEQIQGSKATLRLGETLQLVVGGDWAGVRAQPRGDEDTAQLNHLADESATGRVSAAPATTAPAATSATGAATPTVGGTPATPAPTTVAPPPAVSNTSGIIGLPPAGVPCVRYN
ncbi:MAG: LytR family transcriptional regulator [Actinobacteria bacterium]|nr:MAG: LytR family transcriptional regulator [Actinomycetota bacterium]